MAAILSLIDDFQDLMDRQGDPRTSKWFLMSSPFPTAAICLTYVYIVKVLGPRLMENRKPFELKNLLIAYNFFQVIFSAWLFYECLMSGWLTEYSFRCQPIDYSDNPLAVRISMSGWLTGLYNFRCQPVDYSNNPKTLRMVHACWWYYFSKFTEFFDTFFFVLRKKNSHVSTLHVIHHGVMPMSVWFGVKFTPGGHSTFFGLVNTFVHIIMYTYYLLAAMGPQYQKYLWWKKYLTAFQMVQFVAIMVHAFQLLFIDCNYPKAFVWWIGMHAVMFYFLFSNFYNQAYKSKSRREEKSEPQNETKINHTSVSNGHAVTNGYSKNQASDYYINASTDIHLRTVANKSLANGTN
ncbi:elongation of very long chain fatty acids protein AAEL008004 isoform X1 [Schistocerca nitens]|uniref:elongation of very long chain fatty acids protein AAEL008004 isoform X4 n=1 Tax=Schistocerca cancellata TaxID=274614 RepID=UPI0021176678|nr:elongation of very long chain fatty acids protein AAEL008004 isoform X4 [Schistocerca cancellata]XP_049805513.1 elongation of very long chain fatty acids protein AAEL008004 isoform X1 [Schistocerca nitens]XP_049845277.1 elongation of very long chain fatty acids protein AAEL008004 isoform X3 [Schistocerca gregaria]